MYAIIILAIPTIAYGGYFLLSVLIDYTSYDIETEWFLRYSFPASALLISEGFFAAAGGKGCIKPNKFIVLIYLGAVLLSVVLILLGIGLLNNS